MKKLGILVSHRGTNLQAIIDACQTGQINASPVVVISNNSQAEALYRARHANIPAHHLSSLTHPNSEALDATILKTLQRYQVDLVITAGYMKKLGPKTLGHFHQRILNIHPSLLPKYGGQGMYGMRVHEAVIANDDKISGITIHWMDDQYDTGPILTQSIVPVFKHDDPASLAARVLDEGHKLLIQTLTKLII